MQVGFPHPRFLIPFLSARDIAEAMAYERIEPFGTPRRDLMLAQIAMHVRNKGSSDPREVTDFLPGWKAPPGTPTDDDLAMDTIRQAKAMAVTQDR